VPGADAIVILGSGVLLTHRTTVVGLSARYRLPAIYHGVEFVEDGGLMSYGATITDLFRRAATYVDKILKGTKAAELPFEQPTTFELVINATTALSTRRRPVAVDAGSCQSSNPMNSHPMRPNPAVNRTRRFIASTSLSSTRLAG
jgi:ABC transporter substrate binding protein